MGEKAFDFFFQAAQKLTMSLKVNLSSCVPATPFETSGGEIDPETIGKWHEKYPESSLAELMNVPGLLHGDPEVLKKAELFDRIDGHCPLIRGRELNGCCAAGVVNCHESTDLAEAEEKIRRGMQVLIREGSAARDLEKLIPLITEKNSPFIAFCSDDRSPLEILSSGHIDAMIRRSIAAGASPLAAYRASSWSPAVHAGLTNRGLIAPGKRGDILLLSDLEKCIIQKVLVNGKDMELLPEIQESVPEEFLHTVKRLPVNKDLFRIHSEKKETHVISMGSGSLITEKMICDLELVNGEKLPDPGRDIVKAAILERHGKNGNTGLGFLHGTGIKSGALASTVAHDSHNICVAGTSDEDMALAVNTLIAMQGGEVVVKEGKVIAQVPFPVGGLLSLLPFRELAPELEALLLAAKSTNCTLIDPFQQLSFLALPVIPHLKLTDKGVFDVDIFQHISE